MRCIRAFPFAAALVLCSNVAPLAQPATEPEACDFGYVTEGGLIAGLRDTTAAQAHDAARWENLDKMAGARLHRVLESAQVLALVGWEQLPPSERIGLRTPAEMWLWAAERYRVWPGELRVGQTYDFAIDDTPPFSVRVDTSYLTEPGQTRRRAVGADVLAPGTCLLSVRFVVLPAGGLGDAAIAAEIARIRRSVVEHAGAVTFAPERWGSWLRYVAARYLPPAWAAGLAAAIALGLAALFARRRRRAT
jgi:hypothetical protein